MKLLDKIIDELNDHLMDGVLNEQAFQNSAVYGLSYLTVPKDDSPQRPYTWNGDNIKEVANPDDSYAFSIYHRCNGIAFKDVPQQTFGDGNGLMNMVCDMTAIVYSDRYKTNYTQEDILMKISARLNHTFTRTQLGTSGLQKVKATVLRANNNSTAVFTGEYGQEANCPLAMNSVYFGIVYQLEIIAHSSCLSCTNC